MIKAEQNRRSPLRILEKTAHGGVGKGNIGVIAARKGVGKTACLVHIATDQLFQDKHVIHVSFSADTSHIISWYEDIFNEIAGKFNLDSAQDVHDEIAGNRIIMNFNQKEVDTPQITKSIQTMINNVNFSADTIVVDGYDFKKATVNDLEKFKNFAEEMGLAIWFSASLKDDDLVFDERGVPILLRDFIDLITILIRIKSMDNYVHLELIKDHDIIPVSNLNLKLDPASLLIMDDGSIN